MRRITLSWIVASFMAVALVGCKVEQTKEGSMPDVDVSVTPGTMPEYDVKAAEVDVNTTTKTITVPDVDVKMPE